MSRELDLAVTAAREAGEVLRRSYEQQLGVRYKGPFDLVTEADEESERTISRILREAFPAYGIYAEESGRLQGESRARWIVDPLDGTTNYSHGFPFFAVSIGLEVEGEVQAGVVYNPVLEEMFTAERGTGAALNGRPLRVSTTAELGRSLLASGFPYDRTAAPYALDLWGRFTLLTQGMRRAGSAALDMCYVAAGRLDGYYEQQVQAWDLAAGLIILLEAGGKATNYRGEPFDLEGREVLASNGVIHEAMVRVME